MATILDMLRQQMGDREVSQLSQRLGTDPRTTEEAMSAALPMILGALSRNAQKPQGAQSLLGALDRDHDGSILDDVAGFLNAPDFKDGDGILRHALGQRRGAVETGVSRASGLDGAAVTRMMSMLAPLVMGALGRQKRQENLNEDRLANMLKKERTAVEKGAPGLNPLTRLLDADGDGQVLDDLVEKVGKGLLGGLFRRR